MQEATSRTRESKSVTCLFQAPPEITPEDEDAGATSAPPGASERLPI
ncbi:MAG: hypothetical protein AABO57_07640 [Acidobacteriota bacterium]